jgi:AraC-like DNA-binding protein
MGLVELSIAPGLLGSAWRAGPELPIVSSHRHAELELNLVLRGSATYLRSGRRDRLVRGAILWLWPSEDHILTDRSPDFDIWVAVFRPALVERHSQVAEAASQETRRLSESASDWLHALISAVAAATIAPIEHNAGLEFALLQAWRLYMDAEHSPWQEVHPAVERAALRLRDDPGMDSVADLSRASGLSPSRLGRVFKAQMGISMRAYRNQLRLERFLRLYGRGARLSVTQSAMDAGFGSEAQFYRAFQDAFGTSPRRYTRRARGERNTPSDERHPEHPDA